MKWLNDPHRQSHTYDDLDVYRDIITAVSETLRLMAETDKATPKPPPP